VGERCELLEGVRLEILSNHGHPQYTCLYNMGVFGPELTTSKCADSGSVPWYLEPSRSGIAPFAFSNWSEMIADSWGDFKYTFRRVWGGEKGEESGGGDGREGQTAEGVHQELFDERKQQRQSWYAHLNFEQRRFNMVIPQIS